METVHDEKMAQTLNQMWGKREGAGQPLSVLMQVNTSKDSKWEGLWGGAPSAESRHLQLPRQNITQLFSHVATSRPL